MPRRKAHPPQSSHVPSLTPIRQHKACRPGVRAPGLENASIHAHIKGANARQAQALDTYEQTVLTAFQGVEDGLVAYANEQTRCQALNDSVVANHLGRIK